jgi:hypothetical protein
MKPIQSIKARRKVKRTFLKKGTCSRTFFYILNRENGHPMDNEEQAVDPLAGGIIQQGYQCGMLWGASSAAGAESYRKCSGEPGKATALSIKATQHIMKSFTNRTNTPNCSDIADVDWSNKWDFAKYMLKGKFWGCFKLAEKWAPEAIESANKGLSIDQSDLPEDTLSCASEVVKKMGGTEMEMAIVSGYAGGLGLTGNACGALAATIWKNSLERVKTNSFKYSISDPVTEKILKKFFEETDYEMECEKICEKKFKTVEEHTEFIKNGGCEKLIDVLAEVSSEA